MIKLKSSLQVHSFFINSTLQDLHVNPFSSTILSITSFLTTSQKTAYSTTGPDLRDKNPLLTDYLIKSLEYPPHKASMISSQVRSIISTQKPESVILYLKSLGFSIAHLQSTIRRQPNILLLNVDKIFKPKVKFFQELGLTSHHLPLVISKNPCLLTSSLERKLKPTITVIKRVLKLCRGEKTDDEVNLLLFRILSTYWWVTRSVSILESNVAYLRSCGVVDSQLIMLMKNDLKLFSMRETDLKDLVSRAVEMGFKTGSGMLVYGMLILDSSSTETISAKFRLLMELGFSKDECDLMFVKSPVLFKSSEGKLRRGVEFFTRRLGLDLSVLVGSPFLLSLSMEKRIVPRLKVMEMIKERGLVEREPSFISVVLLTEEEFVRKFLSRFGGDAEELKVAYEKWRLESL